MRLFPIEIREVINSACGQRCGTTQQSSCVCKVTLVAGLRVKQRFGFVIEGRAHDAPCWDQLVRYQWNFVPVEFRLRIRTVNGGTSECRFGMSFRTMVMVLNVMYQWNCDCGFEYRTAGLRNCFGKAGV